MVVPGPWIVEGLLFNNYSQIGFLPPIFISTILQFYNPVHSHTYNKEILFWIA